MSMDTVKVFFKDDKYNYSTAVNPASTDQELKKYFIGTCFNMGGIIWDHENDRETEIDNLQECIDIEITREG